MTLQYAIVAPQTHLANCRKHCVSSSFVNVRLDDCSCNRTHVFCVPNKAFILCLLSCKNSVLYQSSGLIGILWGCNHAHACGVPNRALMLRLLSCKNNMQNQLCTCWPYWLPVGLQSCPCVRCAKPRSHVSSVAVQEQLAISIVHSLALLASCGAEIMPMCTLCPTRAHVPVMQGLFRSVCKLRRQQCRPKSGSGVTGPCPTPVATPSQSLGIFHQAGTT
jgi:hypothetical protein